MSRFQIFILLLIFPNFWLGFSACQFRHVSLLSETPALSKPPIRDRYVFLINLDGSRPQEVKRWAQEGYLPNIQKLFFEQGAVVDNAINSFPTLSTPNHQGFISGLFPGHHGIPALDWYSRPLRRHIDYLKPRQATSTTVLMFNYLQLLGDQVTTDEPQLLFNDLKGHATLAVLEPAHHGASTYIPKRPPAKGALDFYLRESYETLDWIVLKNLMKFFKKVPLEEFPRFSFINFYGIDNVGHFAGPDSTTALDYYIHYDKIFGKLVRLLKSRGLWEKSTLILVSDHGQHYLKEIVDLKALLKRVGFPLKYHKAEKNYIVWGDHGTGTSNLHLRIGNDWNRIPTYQDIRNFPLPNGERVDLVHSFLKEPSIEFVLLREDPQTTHIFTPGQHATIEQKWEHDQIWYRYTPDPGQDPLGYLEETKIQNWVKQKTYQNSEDWLQATAHLQRPDAVVGIAQIFDDGRTGEMIIQSYPDKQFKEVKLAAHGSLEREDRRVNLMLHGPDIMRSQLPYARVVDLYPTLLALFGLETNAPMDGRLRTTLLKPEVLNAPKYTLRNPLQQNKGMTAESFLTYLQSLELNKLNKDEIDKVKQLRFDLTNFISVKEDKSSSSRLSLRDEHQNNKDSVE